MNWLVYDLLFYTIPTTSLWVIFKGKVNKLLETA